MKNATFQWAVLGLLAVIAAHTSPTLGGKIGFGIGAVICFVAALKEAGK